MPDGQKKICHSIILFSLAEIISTETNNLILVRQHFLIIIT